MRYLFCFLVLALLFISCKDQAQKKELNKVEDTLNVAKPFLNPTQDSTPIAVTSNRLPRLFSNGEALYLSWVSEQDSLAVLNFSSYDGAAWTERIQVSEGSDWFVNWADFPVISENDGTILTSHLQKSAEGTYTYDVLLNFYNDSTQTWKRDFILHDDGTKSEHGFVSMVPLTEEKGFFITWLDGRKTVANDSLKGHDNAHDNIGAMTLRGAYVSKNGTVAKRVELDPKVCDCCQTSVAMTSNGPIVAYRDRSDDEVRDISVVRWLGSQQWSEPMRVHKDNWKISGCPVHGPAIDAVNDHVAVAWFTAANDKPEVQVIFSEDQGDTFGLPIRVDGNEAIGRVDVKLITNTEAAILWMETLGNETFIQLVKVDSNGARGEVITISKTSSERASGFPQMERLGDLLYLAWTADATIKTAKVSLAEL